MRTILYNDMIDLLISASSYVLDWGCKDEECEECSLEQHKIWETVFEQDLTLFIRQDAKLFFKNTAFVFFLVRIASVQRDLIGYLRKLSFEGMLEELNTHYVLQLNGSMSIEEMTEQLKEALIDKSSDQPDDTLQIFTEMLKSPEEIMMRISSTLKVLYPLFKEKFFSPGSMAEIEAEVAICNQQLSETPEQFVRQVTMVNYSDEKKVLVDFKYYILYAACEEVIFLHSQHLLLFGITVRQSIETQARRVDLQAFIKLISDPTRYDILKLLNKQKWYGNELAKHFNLTPATISHHLNKFVVLRLIKAESGPQNKIYFELDRDELRRILKDIERDLLQ